MFTTIKNTLQLLAYPAIGLAALAICYYGSTQNGALDIVAAAMNDIAPKQPGFHAYME